MAPGLRGDGLAGVLPRPTTEGETTVTTTARGHDVARQRLGYGNVAGLAPWRPPSINLNPPNSIQGD
jgi:hypothetical protein